MKSLKLFTFAIVFSLLVGFIIGCSGNKNKQNDSATDDATDSIAILNDLKEKAIQDSLKKAEEDSIRAAQLREERYLPDDSIKTKYDCVLFNNDDNLVIAPYNEDPYNRNNFPEKWGLIDCKGNVIADGRSIEIIPPDSDGPDYAFQTPQGFTHFYQKGKGHGVFDKNYKIKIKPIYEDLSLFGEYAVVKKKGQQGRDVLHIPSKKITCHLDDNIKVLNINDGMMLIDNEKDGKSYLDTKGRKRISSDILKKYDEIRPFFEGLACVIGNDHNDYGYIDKTGKEVIPLVYFYYPYCYDDMGFQNGLAIAENDLKMGAIDKKGKVVIPFKYDDLKRDSQGDFVGYIKVNDKVTRIVGINKNGKEKSKYRPPYPSDEWVTFKDEESNREGYMDLSGNIMLPAKYYHPSQFHQGKTLVAINGTINLIDSKGRIILKDIGRRNEYLLPG